MCTRILLTAFNESNLCTYQGQKYQKISLDSRCNLTTLEDLRLQKSVLSFADSDKPGVMVLNPHACIETSEFTDTVPEGALIIEYIEPTSAQSRS